MTVDVIAICIRVQRVRLGLPPDDPVTPEEREAMDSVLDTAAAYRPGIMAMIEQAKGQAVADQLRAKREERDQAELEERARSIIEAVAREGSAATGCDITPALLRAKTGRSWLTPWRQEAWARLARIDMTLEEIGRVFRRTKQAIGEGIERHETRSRAIEGAKEVGRVG